MLLFLILLIYLAKQGYQASTFIRTCRKEGIFVSQNGNKYLRKMSNKSALHGKLLSILRMKLQKCSLISLSASLSGSASRHSRAPSTYSTIVGCNDCESLSSTHELQQHQQQLAFLTFFLYTLGL